MPSPIDFYSDYIAKGIPAYFTGYAKHWPAYTKWQNKTYLIEQSGDQVIYVEKAPRYSNEFAYFQTEFGKAYMTYGDFLRAIEDEDRIFNYYFAEESVPEALLKDIINPEIGDELLKTTIVSFWQGFGTVSLPHQDDVENIMCVLKGYKNFTIVSPLQSHFVYHAEKPNMPKHYSPVNFDNPNLDKYPLFAKANVYKVHIKEGDCMYLPAFWWHQVSSSSEECMAISTWYDTHSKMVKLGVYYGSDFN
mmetsp:Transcript_12901/g.12791  ORF Transcript_12901/g.12791 Transcript_12901/m.12791 type:complete len:248 (+) Transcript_12901:242-985(+)